MAGPAQSGDMLARIAAMLMGQRGQRGQQQFNPFNQPFDGLRNERAPLPPFEQPGGTLPMERYTSAAPSAPVAAQPIQPPPMTAVPPPEIAQPATAPDATVAPPMALPTHIGGDPTALEDVRRAAEMMRFREMFPQFAGGSMTQQRGGA